jgi:hypothetical protein
MRASPCILLLLVAGGCASAPSPPPVFEAPHLADAPVAEVVPAGLTLEGLPAPPARPAPQDEDGFLGDFESHYVNLLGGVRWMDDGDFDDADLDEHWLLGVELTGLDLETGHGYELGLQHSEDEKGSRDVSLQDLYVGYRYTFDARDLADGDDDMGDLEAEGDAQTYVSVGASYANLDVDLGAVDDDDSDLGLYVRAGVSWWLERMRVGVDYRHLFADFDIEGDDVNGDFDQLALVVGFPF